MRNILAQKVNVTWAVKNRPTALAIAPCIPTNKGLCAGPNAKNIGANSGGSQSPSPRVQRAANGPAPRKIPSLREGASAPPLEIGYNEFTSVHKWRRHPAAHGPSAPAKSRNAGQRKWKYEK